MSLPLFILSNKAVMLSTYKNNRSFILSSHEKRCINEIKHIMMENYHDNRVWITNHVEEKIVDKKKLMLTQNTYCDIDDNGESDLEITYLDLTNNMDTMFMSQMKNMMNTEFFVIESFDYDRINTLLTLNGVSMWCEPVNDLTFDTRSYFNDLFNL